MSTSRRCIDCAHSNPNTMTEDDSIVLECRRYPPVPAGRNADGDLEVLWMQVDADDWCGEWKRTPK